MRDDSQNWAARPSEFETLVGASIVMSPAYLDRQTVISSVNILSVLPQGYSGATGWPDIAVGSTYAVRLRRDRVLCVNGNAIADGWHPATGMAVSNMSSAYQVFDMEGTAALDVLQRGAELSLNARRPHRWCAAFLILTFCCIGMNMSIGSACTCHNRWRRRSGNGYRRAWQRSPDRNSTGR